MPPEVVLADEQAIAELALILAEIRQDFDLASATTAAIERMLLDTLDPAFSTEH
jgi:hypothetical protein